MAKYFATWEVVRERMAEDPQAIAASWKMLVAMVKANLESGTTKAWGAFPGTLSGYSIIEGTEMDVMRYTMQYAPHIAFDVRPLVEVSEVEAFLNAAAGG